MCSPLWMGQQSNVCVCVCVAKFYCMEGHFDSFLSPSLTNLLTSVSLFYHFGLLEGFTAPFQIFFFFFFFYIKQIKLNLSFVSHFLCPFPIYLCIRSGTVISVLEKLLSQSTEQDNPSRLVIEAAHGSANKVRELVQKYPDKVSAALLLFAAVHCSFQELFPPGHQDWGWGI